MKKALEIGCGFNPIKRKGYNVIHADLRNICEPDIVFNVEKEIPFKKNSFDLIVANDVLEHLNHFYKAVNNIHDVLKVGGIFEAKMPHYLGNETWVGAEHKRFACSRTFQAYTLHSKNTLSERMQTGNRKFELVKLDYTATFGKLTKPLINFVGFQNYEERIGRVLPIYIDTITFFLKKVLGRLE